MKVAIIQNRFIHGGRLRWMASIISYLNSRSITPDIISYEMKFTAEHIYNSFGIETKFNVREISRLSINLTQEINIVCFNFQVGSKIKEYDCVINSSNSWLGIANFTNVIHYIHFPRKFRLWHDIHYDGSYFKKVSLCRYAHNFMMRIIYTICDRKVPENVIANSNYTATAIKQLCKNTPCEVIYPPLSEEINKTDWSQWGTRKTDEYVLLGRFCVEKGQLQFMKQVKDLPGKFHIIGFADTESEYFKSCLNFSKLQNNVCLRANVAVDDLKAILKTARYYIHTMVNEPFGLSITDAISQGLLPIIHASGGAREIVTTPLLQYEKLSNLPDVLNKLQSYSNEETYEMLCELQNNCNKLFGKKRIDSQWGKQLIHFGLH